MHQSHEAAGPDIHLQEHKTKQSIEMIDTWRSGPSPFPPSHPPPSSPPLSPSSPTLPTPTLPHSLTLPHPSPPSHPPTPSPTLSPAIHSIKILICVSCWVAPRQRTMLGWFILPSMAISSRRRFSSSSCCVSVLRTKLTWRTQVKRTSNQQASTSCLNAKHSSLIGQAHFGGLYTTSRF